MKSMFMAKMFKERLTNLKPNMNFKYKLYIGIIHSRNKRFNHFTDNKSYH